MEGDAKVGRDNVLKWGNLYRFELLRLCFISLRLYVFIM